MTVYNRFILLAGLCNIVLTPALGSEAPELPSDQGRAPTAFSSMAAAYPRLGEKRPLEEDAVTEELGYSDRNMQPYKRPKPSQTGDVTWGHTGTENTDEGQGSIYDLPPEILVYLGEKVADVKDLRNLTHSCRHLHTKLSGYCADRAALAYTLKNCGAKTTIATHIHQAVGCDYRPYFPFAWACARGFARLEDHEHRDSIDRAYGKRHGEQTPQEQPGAAREGGSSSSVAPGDKRKPKDIFDIVTARVVPDNIPMALFQLRCLSYKNTYTSMDASPADREERLRFYMGPLYAFSLTLEKDSVMCRPYQRNEGWYYNTEEVPVVNYRALGQLFSYFPVADLNRALALYEPILRDRELAEWSLEGGEARDTAKYFLDSFVKKTDISKIEFVFQELLPLAPKRLWYSNAAKLLGAQYDDGRNPPRQGQQREFVERYSLEKLRVLKEHYDLFCLGRGPQLPTKVGYRIFDILPHENIRPLKVYIKPLFSALSCKRGAEKMYLETLKRVVRFTRADLEAIHDGVMMHWTPATKLADVGQLVDAEIRKRSPGTSA